MLHSDPACTRTLHGSSYKGFADFRAPCNRSEHRSTRRLDCKQANHGELANIYWLQTSGPAPFVLLEPAEAVPPLAQLLGLAHSQATNWVALCVGSGAHLQPFGWGAGHFAVNGLRGAKGARNRNACSKQFEPYLNLSRVRRTRCPALPTSGYPSSLTTAAIPSAFFLETSHPPDPPGWGCRTLAPRVWGGRVAAPRHVRLWGGNPQRGKG